MTDTNSVCGVPLAIHELAHSLPTPPQGELEQNKLGEHKVK